MNIRIVKIGKRNIKRYAAFCKECGISRGFKDKNKIDALCCKCNNSIINSKKCGQPKTEETKFKMSIAAFNRKGKSNKKQVVRDNSSRKYIKIKTDTQIRLSKNMRSLLNSKLKNKGLSKFGQKTFDLLGYSANDLINHLESKFQVGMSWDNRNEWHIDHDKPDSLFNYTDVTSEEFKKCWSLDNLKPMWAKDNLHKSNKYSGSK